MPGADPHVIRELIEDTVRDDQWGGLLSKPELRQHRGVPISAPDERTRIQDFRPRGIPARVAEYRAVAGIVIISSHRHEWLEPVHASDVLVADDQTRDFDAARSLGITAVPATGDDSPFLDARARICTRSRP